MRYFDYLILLLTQFVPEYIFQFAYTLSAHRREGYNRHIIGVAEVGNYLTNIFFGHSVGLANSEYSCFREQLGIIFLQLRQEHFVLMLRILAACGNEEQEHSVAFNVAQEAQTKTFALGSAFDDSGYIRHAERPVVAVGYNAQLRCEGSERIIRYLRFGGRNDTEQG